MKKLCMCSCAIFLSLFFAINPQLSKAGELSISVGEGKSRWYFRDRGELTSSALRIAYIHPTVYQWSFSDNKKLALELEAGAHRWDDPWLEKSKYGVFVNPMWRFYIPALSQQLYLGFGIGIAYTNDDNLMDRELGSRLLFEDRFEAGFLINKKHRVSISVNHYSNAKLADINHGVNYYFVNYAYSL